MAKKDKRMAPELLKALEEAVEISQETEKVELSPRERRIALAKELEKEKKEDIDHREEFRKYFIQLKTKLNLDSSLENIVWLHLKAIKHDDIKMFENGVKNFGIIK
jgi:gamma-glutamyl phosphate reductase